MIHFFYPLQDCEESFFVCDLGDVVQKYKVWCDSLPRVKPYFGEFNSKNFADSLNLMVIYNFFIYSKLELVSLCYVMKLFYNGWHEVSLPPCCVSVSLS